MTSIPTDPHLLHDQEAKHPAKFSKGFVEMFRSLLHEYLEQPWRLPEPAVLDPFAGVGTIHQLRPEFITYGMEIEKEWAEQSQFTLTGDSTQMPDYWTETFDAVVTSPTYGNRMADHHMPGMCTACEGYKKEGGKDRMIMVALQDIDLLPDCPKCNGTGRESSKRNTYYHVLGHNLQENNTGMYQFTQFQYKELHSVVYKECYRVLVRGGIIIVNVSDHIRRGEVVKVVEWHRLQLKHTGFHMVAVRPVTTQRLGFGANADARVENEHILVFRKET